MTRDLTALWTFQDAVDHVLDAFDAHREERDLRRARDAVLHANRRICEIHDWQWMHQRLAFRTEEVYDTGTVVYDHSALTLTLTGGTWPSTAAYGNVTLDGENNIYPIDRRVSGTVVTLFSDNNPGEDVASSAYRWYRDEYECPADLRRNMDLWDLSLASIPFQLRYVPEICIRDENYSLWYRFYSTVDSSQPLPIYDVPQWWTVRRSDKYDSGFAITFSHIPQTARLYELSYWKSPRRLKYDSTAVTGLTTTADSVSVTGGAFVAGHVGSILRVSASSTAPTSVIGDIARATSVNPYSFQAYIDSYTSATAISLLSAAPVSLSGVAGVVSDPIDIDQRYMLDLFLAIAKSHYAKHTQRKDVAEWVADERAESIRAQEADEDYRRSRGLHLYGAY